VVKLESMRDHHQSEHWYRAKVVKHDDDEKDSSAPSSSGDASAALATFVQVANSDNAPLLHWFDAAAATWERPDAMRQLCQVSRELRQAVETNFPLYESKKRTFLASQFQDDDAQTITDLYDRIPRGHREAWLLEFYGIEVPEATTFIPRSGDMRRISLLQTATQVEHVVAFRECYSPNTMTPEDIQAEIDTKKHLWFGMVLFNPSCSSYFNDENYDFGNFVARDHFLFDPNARIRMTFFDVHISYRYDSPDVTQNVRRLEGAAKLLNAVSYFVRKLTYSFHLLTSSVFPFQFTTFQASVIQQLLRAAAVRPRGRRKLCLEMYTDDTVHFPNETELATAFDGMDANWCFARTVKFRNDTFSFTGATARYFNAFWHLHRHVDVQYELSVRRRPLDNKINAVILEMKL